MVELIKVPKIEQEEGNADNHGEEKADVHEEKTEKVKRRRKRVSDPQRKKACVDCTKRCIRVHGMASSSSEKARPIPTLPSFFKIMVGYFSENMDIPHPFARTITDLTGSNVYLEDAYGLRWRVRLYLHDGALSFGHGWKNFVLDHDISVGEFLVFRQIARSVFTVQIFAISACERIHLCERNKRQSRKRKPGRKTGYPANNQMVKISSKDVVKRRKKQRTDEQRYDLDPRQHCMPVHVCIDSDSELKCSESSVKELDVAAADESHAVVPVPTTESNADPSYNAAGMKTTKKLDAIGASSNTKDMTGDADKSEDYPSFSYLDSSNVMAANKQSAHSHQDRPIQLYCELGLEDGNAEADNCENSTMLENAELRTPLAMMDLNEVSIDDIFLSADIYEFDSDFCSPEAFSVELNTEVLVANGRTPGDCFGMPETSTCLENRQMSDLPRTSADAGCVAVHGIDINALPSKELSGIGQDNTCTEIGEAHDDCKEGKDIMHSEGNKIAQKGSVSAHSSAKQDIIQEGPRQIAAETMSRSPKPCELTYARKNSVQPGFLTSVRQYAGNNSKVQESGSTKSCVVLAVAANNKKFCITVPPPDQTWLELPRRLPVLPRTKKQARKILILKDPCMRLWPVLYQCTPKFNGFIAGWADISRENNLREGDTCEFELCSNSELSFQVLPNLQ
uniref:TF-B3 domain-containing protein n=1 Tax=Oryza punctata TaxID=4537 RepID=A0A0E0JSF7_ORYPU